MSTWATCSSLLLGIALIGAVPRAAGAQKDLAQSYESRGQSEKSAAEWAAFVERFPNDPFVPEARDRQAQALLQAGRFDDAIAAWERFLSAHPNHPLWPAVREKIVTATFQKGQGLQASGDVDRVAGCEAFLGPCHDLAGHHADPALEREVDERVAHLECRPYGAQRVVLAHNRHAEDGHHGVADELLDGAAVALDDRLHPLEVAGEQRTEALGIEPVAEGGRAGEVAEEDGHGLALLVLGCGRLGATLGAEPERRLRLEAAAHTARHVASLERHAQNA